MRKMGKMLLGACMAAAVLSGCSKTEDKTLDYGNDFTIASDADAQEGKKKNKENTPSLLLDAPAIGEFEIADYHNMVVEVSEMEPESVSEEELSYYIQMRLSEYPEEVKNRGVEAGDHLLIDFTGTINGEEFDGGSGTDVEFDIGYGELLDEFEEALYGKLVGDTCITTVTFPDNYVEGLAGKTAEFTITLKKISTIPALTKEFIAEHTKAGSESIGDYYNELEAEYLTLLKKQYVLDAVQQAVVDLSENCTINPSEEFKTYMDDYYHTDFNKYLELAGLTLEEYKEIYKLDDAAVEADIQETIQTNLPRFAVLKYIAEKEGLTVTDQDVLDYYQEYYGEEQTIEELKELYDSQYDIVELQVAVFSYLADQIQIQYVEPAEENPNEIAYEIPDVVEGDENTIIDAVPAETEKQQ